MQLPVIQSYYNQLVEADSLEKDVDSLWMNILGLYFTVAKNFGLEREVDVNPFRNTNERSKTTVRCIKNVNGKKVILIEDNRCVYTTQTEAEIEALLSQIVDKTS